MNQYVAAGNLSAVLANQVIIPTVTLWNRLEGRPRTHDHNALCHVFRFVPCGPSIDRWRTSASISLDCTCCGPQMLSASIAL